MRLRSVLVLLSTAVLLAGLLLLPASIFTFLSAFLLLPVPSLVPSRHYTRLSRAITALLIVGAVYLSSWAVFEIFEDGRPILQALPWLTVACLEAREALSFLFFVSLSPACRLIVLGPMQEFGSGFFVELFLLINLVWVKLNNYQDRTSCNASETGWGDVVLFIVQVLLMGFMARHQDMALSAEPIEPPDAVVLSIFFVLGAIVMYAWATMHGLLFTASGRQRRARRGFS